MKHTGTWTLGEHETHPIGKQRKPVKAMTDPPMVFPSASTAAKMLQINGEKITRNALEFGHKIAGVAWESSQESVYRRQRMPAEVAKRLIMEMRASKKRI